MERASNYIRHRLEQVRKRAEEERQGEPDMYVSAMWGRIEALTEEAIEQLPVISASQRGRR